MSAKAPPDVEAIGAHRIVAKRGQPSRLDDADVSNLDVMNRCASQLIHAITKRLVGALGGWLGVESRARKINATAERRKSFSVSRRRNSAISP